MNTYKPLEVKVTKEHIEELAKSSTSVALAELIWNGFDASSPSVDVKLNMNAIDGIESITIEDKGDGIPNHNLAACFGGIGNSWKKSKKKDYPHPLHGKHGRGRFKAFCLGSNVEWATTYLSENGYESYAIQGNRNKLNDFRTTSVKTLTTAKKGTIVTINNILTEKENDLLKDKLNNELTKKFAVFLTEYPHLSLDFNGRRIEPKDVQNHVKEYDLTDHFNKITSHPIRLTIIEWTIETDRTINICSSKGISLYEFEPKNRIRAKGFNYTAYIKSEFFEELEAQNQLSLGELNPEVAKVLDYAINKIKSHFRNRISERYSGIVSEWKALDIYPYDNNKKLGPVQKAEQELFDILAVNVQTFLPNFDKTEVKSKKFMFKLLAQAITENPNSVQKIIIEVLGLSKKDQDKLAELLDNTSLSSVISSASVVAHRLNFLDALEELLFNKDTKKTFTERDQLHKILEHEAWIFHEDFSLSLSEERLNTVLETHLKHLGTREDEVDTSDPVYLSDGRTGRIDLMLSRANSPRPDELDYLVVELKRASKKIDDDVITQIKKYAKAVTSDSRFNNISTKWTFIAVSTEMDSYAEDEANQRNKPRGLIHDSAESNVTVWIKTWSEIIHSARAKLNFINKHLNYSVSKESSQKLLREKYSEYIPKTSNN